MKARWLIATAVVALLLGGIGTATAKHLLTSSDIRDRTIHGRDIARGTVTRSNLTDGVQRLLNRSTTQTSAQSQNAPTPGAKGDKGDTGPKGDRGDRGDKGDKGDDGAPGRTAVTTLPSLGFSATNTTVKLGPDGVLFGPYTDGGNAGGSVCFDGLNGKTLKDVTELLYVARYRATNDTGGVGVPYLRVFLNNDNDDAIFSPNTQQPNPDVAQGPFHLWPATSGSWRYDDDAGNNPDVPFSTVVANHGNETISGLCITLGFSNGQNLDGLLRSWEINGTNFVFGTGAGAGELEAG
jgi:hypothetical protein